MHIYIVEITGLILSFASNQNIIVHCADSCKISKQGSLKFADCSRTNYVDIPQDQDNDIQALDISFNKHCTINQTSFGRYPALVKFVMRKVSFTEGCQGIHWNAFLRLTKLEYVDLTNSSYNNFWYEYPENVKVLIVQQNTIRWLATDKMKRLEELHADHTIMYEFPKFHKESPLRIVDVKYCPISVIDVMSIAPFCRLTRLGLKFRDRSYLHHSANYCKCTRLKAWMTDKHIRSNPLNCTRNPSSKEECKTEFTSDESEAFRSCHLRMIRKITWGKLIYLVGMFILTTISLLISAYLIYTNREALKRPGGGDAAHTTPEPIGDSPQEIVEFPDEIPDDVEEE